MTHDQQGLGPLDQVVLQPQHWAGKGGGEEESQGGGCQGQGLGFRVYTFSPQQLESRWYYAQASTSLTDIDSHPDAAY